MDHALLHPQYLTLLNDSGDAVTGCNQDWFRSTWQRRAGCGPTTATNLLIYHQRSGRIQMQPQLMTTSDAADLMQKVWQHVTPSALGVHTPGIFHQGLNSLFAEMNAELSTLPCNLKPVSLMIHRRLRLRPPLIEVVDFIRDGLQADSPVAFLNLHNGSIQKLDRWHWVTLTALSEADPRRPAVQVCDNLNTFVMDIGEWLKTTTLGGGFVYLK